MLIFFGQILMQSSKKVPGVAVADPCVAEMTQVGMFEVNLPFGSFTYLQAKYLDAAWNLVVGKGLQGVAAWVCYKLFAMGLLKITEKEKVEVGLYVATAMYPTEMWTLWKYVRGLAVVGLSTRRRAVLTVICVAAAYVLTLSTVLDLVTGYVTTLDATIKLADGSYASLEQLRWYDTAGTEIDYYYQKLDPMPHASISTQTLSGQNFTFDELIDNSTRRWKSPPIVCVPGPTYQWGFSAGWIEVLLISTLVWIWGMFGLYVDARKHDILWKMGRRLGLYRDILDVAEAIQEELGPYTCGYSDRELSREVDKLDPVGFTVVQGEGNTRNISLSTSVSDIDINSLQSSGMYYGRRAVTDNVTRVVVDVKP
jgi:hypothetical protein